MSIFTVDSFSRPTRYRNPFAPDVADTIRQALAMLKPFLPFHQAVTLRKGMDGEEWEYFCQTALKLALTVKQMPQTGETEDLGDRAIIHLHYFGPSQDWWITEKDIDADQKGQLQAFGLADLFRDGGELGYISIAELIAHPRIELDWHWKPITLAELRKKRGQ